MDTNSANYLALKVQLKIITPEEREKLAAMTLQETLKVAKWCAANGYLRPCDVEDVAQDAVLRALDYVWSWRLNPQTYGTSWSTYINVITRRVASDYGRRLEAERRKLTDFAVLNGEEK